MIRKYKDEDKESLVEIWQEAASIVHSFLPKEFMEKEPDNIRNIYIPNTETWVYELDQRVVGYIAMIENEVGGLFIYPNFQKRGIGKELMDAVAKNFSSLEVEVFEKNAGARMFYEKYGFQFMHSHKHKETGETLYRMSFSK